MLSMKRYLLVANSKEVLASEDIYEFLLSCCRVKESNVYVTMPGYKEMLVFGCYMGNPMTEDRIIFNMMKILRGPDKDNYWPTIDLYTKY